MQEEKKYQSVLDSITTYEFMTLPELVELISSLHSAVLAAKKPAPPRNVRVLGKFVETVESTSIAMDGVSVQCNLTQMRHQCTFSSSNYYEFFGQLV